MILFEVASVWLAGVSSLGVREAATFLSCVQEQGPLLPSRSPGRGLSVDRLHLWLARTELSFRRLDCGCEEPTVAQRPSFLPGGPALSLVLMGFQPVLAVSRDF